MGEDDVCELIPFHTLAGEGLEGLYGKDGADVLQSDTRVADVQRL